MRDFLNFKLHIRRCLFAPNLNIFSWFCSCCFCCKSIWSTLSRNLICQEDVYIAVAKFGANTVQVCTCCTFKIMTENFWLACSSCKFSFLFVLHFFFVAPVHSSSCKHLNRALAGRSRSTANVRGSLFFTSQNSLFIFCRIIRFSNNNKYYFVATFMSPHQQTCSRKHHEVLDLKNLLALVIRFCVCTALEASSSSFVSFDSWKRQRAHDSIIPISCWLGNTTNRFFMLSICGFRQDSVRQVENWLDSRIHTTGLYFCTITTIPWWWSGQSKCVSFY